MSWNLWKAGKSAIAVNGEHCNTTHTSGERGRREWGRSMEEECGWGEEGNERGKGKGRERWCHKWVLQGSSLPCTNGTWNIANDKAGLKVEERACHAGQFWWSKVIQSVVDKCFNMPSRKHPVLPMECWMNTRKLIHRLRTRRCVWTYTEADWQC